MDFDRSLFIRGNRAMGLALVQAGLVSQQNLDQANARLIDCLRSGALKGAGILPILTHEMNALPENFLLQHQAAQMGIGLIDLGSYQVRTPPGTDAAMCWATWTLPIDEREGIRFLASAYYLSQPVREAWETLCGGPVVWYAASLETLIAAIEKMEGSPTTAEAK